MPSRQKFRSRYVFWDLNKCTLVNKHDIEIYRCHGKLKLPPYIARFDSQHEFKVYLQLCRLFGADRIIRQYPIDIIPPGCCYPKGKTWRVDFAIIGSKDRESYSYFIEAKGAFLPEFSQTIAFLEAHSISDFEKLKIVFIGKLPEKSKVIKSLLKGKFKDNLLTLNQLKKLKALS